MPFSKYSCDDEDPEELAEREMQRTYSSIGSPITRSSSHPKTPLSSAPLPSPVKPVKKAHAKQAKALRKKRNRGVSGSSIKKDGGRFEYGLDYDDGEDDDYEEPSDEVEQDEYEARRRYGGSFSSRSVGFGSMESDSEHSNDSSNLKPKETGQLFRFVEALKTAISGDDDGIGDVGVADLLSEEYDETGRVKLIHDAFMSICTERKEAVDDPLYEFRLVTMLERFIDQGLVKGPSIISYVINAPVFNHVIRMFDKANMNGSEQRDAPALMDYVGKLAKELATDYNTKDIVGDLNMKMVPFFHSHFVHQFCLEAINTMHLDVIYFAPYAFKDMIEMEFLDKVPLLIGIERFYRGIADIEVDLPGATSLAMVLTSYAVNDYHLFDETVSCFCPKPRRFIKANAEGKLSVLDDNGEECNEDNYFKSEI